MADDQEKTEDIALFKGHRNTVAISTLTLGFTQRKAQGRNALVAFSIEVSLFPIHLIYGVN